MRLDKAQVEQVAFTGAILIVTGGLLIYGALHPGPADYLSVAAIHSHPLATVFGALLPLVILIPFLYWVAGRILRRRLLHNRHNKLAWQTFIENAPEITEAVERLSCLSPKHVEEFRALLLQYRDCARMAEFEKEAIRRVQGQAFAEDANLREAYIALKREDNRLCDELLRVVRIIGRPNDLERTVGQIRKNSLREYRRRAVPSQLVTRLRAIKAWLPASAMLSLVGAVAVVLLAFGVLLVRPLMSYSARVFAPGQAPTWVCREDGPGRTACGDAPNWNDLSPTPPQRAVPSRALGATPGGQNTFSYEDAMQPPENNSAAGWDVVSQDPLPAAKNNQPQAGGPWQDYAALAYHGPGRLHCDGQWDYLHRPAAEYSKFLNRCLAEYRAGK